MNDLSRLYSLLIGKATNNKVRLVLFLLVLVLFVLGTGAPEAGGGIIDRIIFHGF